MKPEVEELLDKARRSIKTANNIFKDGEVDFAGSRAYYALFYIAEALLLERGLAFSSHSAVIANFGKEFAKPKSLNPKFHTILLRRRTGET